jgi:hypothetical protein
MRTTLFPTGDKPKKKRPAPVTPTVRPVPADLMRAAVAATLADALTGLAPDRRAAVLVKAIALLAPRQQDAVTRFVVELLREVPPSCGRSPG